MSDTSNGVISGKGAYRQHCCQARRYMPRAQASMALGPAARHTSPDTTRPSARTAGCRTRQRETRACEWQTSPPCAFQHPGKRHRPVSVSRCGAQPSAHATSTHSRSWTAAALRLLTRSKGRARRGGRVPRSGLGKKASGIGHRPGFPRRYTIRARHDGTRCPRGSHAKSTMAPHCAIFVTILSITCLHRPQ